jgi:hypothetical protein
LRFRKPLRDFGERLVDIHSGAGCDPQSQHRELRATVVAVAFFGFWAQCRIAEHLLHIQLGPRTGVVPAAAVHLARDQARGVCLDQRLVAPVAKPRQQHHNQ